MKRFTSLLAVVTVIAAGSVVLFGAGVAGASSASTASALPTLTIGLSGKTVTVGGSMVSGAVNITTTVTGKPGEPALVRLNPGVSFAQFGQAVQAVNSHHGDLNYLDPYASLVYDGPEFSGTNTDQVDLQPGNYFALNTGSDGAPPHRLHRLPSASPAALPTPAATVSSIEFGFTGAKVLHDGELVRFQNLGFLVHMDVWCAPRASPRPIRSWHSCWPVRTSRSDVTSRPRSARSRGRSLPAPCSNRSSPSGRVWYVQACFMDTQDGREHTRLEMERILKIVK